MTALARCIVRVNTRMPSCRERAVRRITHILRVQLELSIQAKALLVAREAGLTIPPHEDAYRAIEEEQYLRKSIGRTGLLALRPLHVSTHRDAWHQYLLSSRSLVALGLRRFDHVDDSGCIGISQPCRLVLVILTVNRCERVPVHIVGDASTLGDSLGLIGLVEHAESLK